MEHAVVLVTAGSRDEARSIATALVAEHLAACVQMLPIESHYVWDGEVVDDDEILLLVKTRTDAFERIRPGSASCTRTRCPRSCCSTSPPAVGRTLIGSTV